ncbi:hypothetical protein IWX90DRAFT_473982 [Phyllosticta citrichinensis]|uniref:C2H2-type domain-containing protein n=1 Tax=Phyllosticta citrichinensis TaxID=1130410 RepID=A0ABR1Y512_9PEZI
MAPSTYRDHHPPSDMDRSCLCRICGKDHRARRYFNDHMAEDHDGVKPYMCPGCNDMWTDNLSSLRRHYWRSCKHDHARSPDQQFRIRQEREATRRRDRRAERARRRAAQQTQEELDELEAEVQSLEEEIESVSNRARIVWQEREVIKERLGGTVAEGGPATEDEYHALVAHHDEVDVRIEELDERVDAAKRELGQ